MTVASSGLLVHWLRSVKRMRCTLFSRCSMLVQLLKMVARCARAFRAAHWTVRRRGIARRGSRPGALVVGAASQRAVASSCEASSAIRREMQKHTRSRPTSRSASVESAHPPTPPAPHESGGGLLTCLSPSPRRYSQHHVPVPSPLAAGVATSSSVSGRQSRQTTSPSVSASASSLIPEPVRRWHSFHSRRSSVQQPASAPSDAGDAKKAPPASRFLSPPPLAPRRRFSVW